MLSHKKDYIQAYEAQIAVNVQKFMFLLFDWNNHAEFL